MSVLLGMLSPSEKAALGVVARECGDRFRPWSRLSASRTSLRQLAKLGLVDMCRGDIDGARLVRLSRLAAGLLADIGGSP